jgi:hypothetical protein
MKDNHPSKEKVMMLSRSFFPVLLRPDGGDVDGGGVDGRGAATQTL